MLGAAAKACMLAAVAKHWAVPSMTRPCRTGTGEEQRYTDKEGEASGTDWNNRTASNKRNIASIKTKYSKVFSNSCLLIRLH